MPRITIEGDLQTDYETIYVGGMCLDKILAAALPHRDDLKREGRKDFGPARISIEADIDEVPRERKPPSTPAPGFERLGVDFVPPRRERHG